MILVKTRRVPDSGLIAAYSEDLKPLLVHAMTYDDLWIRVADTVKALCGGGNYSFSICQEGVSARVIVSET